MRVRKVVARCGRRTQRSRKICKISVLYFFRSILCPPKIFLPLKWYPDRNFFGDGGGGGGEVVKNNFLRKNFLALILHSGAQNCSRIIKSGAAVPYSAVWADIVYIKLEIGKYMLIYGIYLDCKHGSLQTEQESFLALLHDKKAFA